MPGLSKPRRRELSVPPCTALVGPSVPALTEGGTDRGASFERRKRRSTCVRQSVPLLRKWLRQNPPNIVRASVLDQGGCGRFASSFSARRPRLARSRLGLAEIVPSWCLHPVSRWALNGRCGCKRGNPQTLWIRSAAPFVMGPYIATPPWCASALGVEFANANSSGCPGDGRFRPSCARSPRFQELP